MNAIHSSGKVARNMTTQAARISAIALAVKFACGTLAYADLPTGGNIVSGAGNIGQNGNTLTVNQQTARMGVEWESFNVGAGQRVQFVQPDANSVALNRVVGSDASKIMGSLDANGKVFLVNPNGVLFGKDAQVNTGGLVASSLDISDADFAAGNYRFTKGARAGSVVNSGNLTAGSVVLIAPTIENSGSINTYKGNTTLAAGEAVTVSVMNNGLITATVDKAALNASIQNSGRVIADGGSISLQAGTADAVLDSLINTEGLLQARSIENRDGRIFLGSGAGGTTVISGTVDASGYTAGQKGGEITALGKNIGVFDAALLDASGNRGGGKVLVGGNWQGQGPEMNATAVLMDPTARIKADATDNGNGGTAVLWSNDYTVFAGSISARGGANGGNGGNVETSGKNILQATGIADVFAPRGAAGQWLLDPTDIIINSGATNTPDDNGTPTRTYTPSPGVSTSYIQDFAITGALNAGTNVVVTTTSTGAGTGTITVNAPLPKVNPGNVTLTLRAERDIIINSPISSTSGRLNVVLNSRSANGATGTITFNSAGSITTNGGYIYAYGGSTQLGGAAVNSASGSGILINSTLNAGGGNIHLIGSTTYATVGGRGITLSGATAQLLTSGTGTITLTGTATGAGSGLGFGTSGGNPRISAAQGAVTLSGTSASASGMFITGTVSTTTGNIVINGTTSSTSNQGINLSSGTLSITSTSGNISLTGVNNHADAAPGIWLYQPATIQTGGAGSVTLSGTGGSNLSSSQQAAILFGASSSTPVSIQAGTGGVSITGNGITGTAYSVYGNAVTIASQGAVTINGNSGVYLPSSITANGALSVTSSAIGNITLGSMTTATAAGSILVSAYGGAVTLLGPITHGGSGNMTFQAATDLLVPGSITKTSTGRSFLALEARRNIDIDGVISSSDASSAGALDVLMRSRTGDDADGWIDIGNDIRTRGGDIFAWGGSDSTPGNGLTRTSDAHAGILVGAGRTLDADGGHIALWGGANSGGGTALEIGANATLRTINAGNLRLHGISNGNSTGVYVNDGVTVSAGGSGTGTGNLTIKASSTSGSTGARLSGGSYLAGGEMTVTGRTSSTSGVGIVLDTDNAQAIAIHAGGPLMMTGSGGDGIHASSTQSVTLESDTSIALHGSATQGVALALVSPLSMIAGAGGVTITSAVTDPDSMGVGSFDTLGSGSIVTTGAVSITGQGVYQFMRPIQADGGITIDMTNTVMTSTMTSHGAVSLRSGRYLFIDGAIDANGNDITARALDEISLSAPLTGANIYLSSDGLFTNYVGASALNASGRWVVYSNAPTGNTYGGLVSGNNAIWRQSYSTLAPASVASGNRYVFRYSPQGGIVDGTVTKTYGETLPLYVPLTSLTPYTNTQGGMWVADTIADIAAGSGIAIDHLISSGLAFDANVGLYSLSGTSYFTASGYSLAVDAAAQLEVLKRAITVSALSDTRTYDGTTVSLVTPTITSGSLVAGDTVTWTQAFDDRNTGSGKTLTATGTIDDGNGGNNYDVTFINDTTGVIDRRNLTVTAQTDTKTYDGTTSSAATPTLTSGSLVAGDTVTWSQLFGNRNAGTGKQLIASGVVNDGNGGDNYNVTFVDSMSGTINRLALTAALIGHASKEYDGNTDITLSDTNFALSGVLAGDTVSVDPVAPGVLDDKNVGTGKNVTVGSVTLTGADANNYLVTGSASGGIAEVTAKLLTASLVGNASRVYDATTGIALSGANYHLDGVVAGDIVDLDNPTLGVLDSKNVGTGKNVSVSGLALSGAGAGNYLVNSTADANIGEVTARTITASLIGNASRVYDGTTDIALTGANYHLNGVLAGDSVDLNNPVLGTLDNKNVGTGKDVSVSGLGLSGTDAGNYIVNTTANASIGEVTQRALTLAAVSDTRVYDRTTDSNGVVSVTGLVTGDTVTASQSFDSANAGSRTLSVNAGYSVDDGNGGNNYVVSTTDAAGTIDRRDVFVTVNADDRIYDGTTTATGTVTGITGILVGDTVVSDGNASFAFVDKNVGTGKSVSVSGMGLSGADAANYQVASASASNASITQRSLTASLIGSTSRVYDATTDIALTGANYQLSGVIAGDSVDLNNPVLGMLDHKNVGAGKNVSVAGLGLSGADAGNYTVNATANADIGEVTAKALTVALIGNTSRVYDGTTDIALTGANYGVNGVIAGDNVDLNNPVLGAFDNKNAGTGKNVSVSGLSISGTDAGNYTVNSTANANIGEVTQRALTLAAVSDTKIYDRTTSSNGVVSVTGLIGGDTITASQSFDSANAGGRTLSVDGSYVIADGNGGSNYLVTTSDALGIIDRRDVIVSVAADDKVYDGNTIATGSVTGISGILAGDTVISDGQATFAFADKDVGSGKSVSVSGMALAGADALNYQVASVGSSNASITPASLLVSAVPGNKIYGSADPSLTYGYSGLQGSDDTSVFTGSLTRAAGENVGVYSIGQGTLSAGSNYIISYIDAGFRINPATLTIGAIAGTKVYGDVDPALGYNISGLVNGDTAGVITGALGRTAGENVGSYNIGLGSLSAGDNYTIAYTGNTFDITRRTLIVNANDPSKIYGNADPSLTFSHGTLYNGDTNAIFSGSLSRVAGENVGSYAISQGTLSAGNNYDLQFTGGQLAITPRTLTIAANARGKSYGEIDPTLSFTHGTLVNGDSSAIFSGALSRDAGENVGSYAIHQGTLSAGSNYVIDFTGNAFDISTGLLVVNADARSKIYGDLDPSLTYTFSGLVNGDDTSVFTGALTRASGENVGNYVINRGTLDAGLNYTIQFNSADLAITRRDLFVTADTVSKVYGSIDPSLAYSFSGLVNGDTASVFSGGLARNAGENVNSYAITQGSLSAGGNYALHYTGNTFAITPATLSVVANAASKIYGDLDPTLTYAFTGLVNGDTAAVFTGDLSRAAGETVLGGPYAIHQGSLTAGGNYIVDFTGNALSITPKALIVDVANNITKVYDGTTALPTGTQGYGWSGLIGSDDVGVLGTLAFDSRNAGTRSITLSNMSLSGADASNYYLPMTSATGSGTITQRAITVTAQADGKVYDGNVDSNIAALLTSGSLVAGDTATWTQSFDNRNAGAGKTLNASGVVDDGNDGNNYAVTFVSNHDGAVDRRAITVSAQSDSKTQDGNVSSVGQPTITSGTLVAGDTGHWTQSFGDIEVGTGKTLAASGTIDDGNEGNNYEVTYVSNHDGTILARETVPGPTPTLDELSQLIRTVANLGHSDSQQIRSTLNSESAKAQQGVRMVNDALQSCGEAENGGVRMPERPAAFLERNGSLGGACEFFSGNN